MTSLLSNFERLNTHILNYRIKVTLIHLLVVKERVLSRRNKNNVGVFMHLNNMIIYSLDT